MKRMGDYYRKVLFKCLSFENYLFVLSQLYFFMFHLNLLRKNKHYQYPYFLKRIIQRGDIIIDIGANLGYYTRLFSKRVKTEGKVYAVEPVKPILKVLRKNTKRLNNVEICPFALGQEDKPIMLGNESKRIKGFIASGSNFILDQNHTAHKKEDIQFEAEMKKGSSFFQPLNKLDFIKMDVEGYETHIIEDMEPLIQKFKPLILMETRGKNRKDMISFLKERSYSPYVLHKNLLYPTNEYEYTDILFIPDQKRKNLSKFIAPINSSDTEA